MAAAPRPNSRGDAGMAQSALVSAERLPTLPSAESLADFIALLPQPLVVTTADGEGRFLLANAAARAIAGIPTPDISAYRSPDFFHDRGDRARILESIMRDGEINACEVRLKTTAGEALWVLLSSRLFRYCGEAVLLTSFQDIT